MPIVVMCDVNTEMVGYLMGGWAVVTGVFAYRNADRFMLEWFRAFSYGVGIFAIGAAGLCLISTHSEVTSWVLGIAFWLFVGFGFWYDRQERGKKVKKQPSGPN